MTIDAVELLGQEFGKAAGGRFGGYKYYDMDKSIDWTLKISLNWYNKHTSNLT